MNLTETIEWKSMEWILVCFSSFLSCRPVIFQLKASPVEISGTNKYRILNHVFIFFDHQNNSFLPLSSTVGNRIRIFGMEVKKNVFANTPTLFNFACCPIVPFILVSICSEFSEASEGVGWGFRGLYPSEPPRNPQATPSEVRPGEDQVKTRQRPKTNWISPIPTRTFGAYGPVKSEN